MVLLIDNVVFAHIQFEHVVCELIEQCVVVCCAFLHASVLYAQWLQLLSTEHGNKLPHIIMHHSLKSNTTFKHRAWKYSNI